MEIFIGIIAIGVLLFSIAYWKHILSGLFCALAFGSLGFFFGGNILGSIGIVLGLISGIGVQIDEEKEKEKKSDRKPEKKDPKANTAETKFQKNKTSDTRIVCCPTCKKKIRVKLPLQGKKGKCLACLNSFHILMEKGQVRVKPVTTNKKPNSSENLFSILNCYKILEITKNASPDEVKLAYKKKIRLYHPDRVSGLGKKLQKLANEESQSINTAYSILKTKGLAS